MARPSRGDHGDHAGNRAGDAGGTSSGSGPSRRSLLAVTGAAALALGTTTACSRVSAAAEGEGGDLLERLRERKTVKLGIESQPPLSYYDENGTLTGCDPEIAKRIFPKLGVPNVESQPIEFNSLIAGLNSQQFDVIAAGMYINAKRCEQVHFADPHYRMQDQFIVAQGNPKNLENYRDATRPDVKLATVVGYAEIEFAKDAGVDPDDMQLVHDPLSGLLAVEQERAHAFSTTTACIRHILKHSGSSKVEGASPFNPRGGKRQLPGGGFAFRKNETRLRHEFNKKLQAMKDSHELLHLMQGFGFKREEIDLRKAKELCR